ncbi:hypothetical protein FHS43_004366 [Streptosporangium becharense]|uniref:MFS transporter n=1 Tax=Streptosporangium becharense TaxID=1816182 RepID=A0A7W9IKM9_9ACTN|nr:hypothetical protein [Streptosporangium becharense]MBB2913068.1 hypothetical protein [Streptosporangium becharense]MBB5822051.1 hypothetical protein [Streptosporangium becharense]
MAVPPIQPTRAVAAGPAGLVRVLRAAPLPDVVLGLLVAIALPLAIVAIPNTISVVAALLPPGVSQIEMIRAHGLALPVMVLTVPAAAVAVRRTRPAFLVVAGLALIAAADAAGGYAASTFAVGCLRALHGVGAGLLVPATLMMAWGRSPALRAVWAATLAVSLVAAQALALGPLDEVSSWRVSLQPYPMLTGVALVLAALHLVFWLEKGEDPVRGPAPVPGEQRRSLLVIVPAAGVAALAVGGTFDWSATLVVRAALVSLLALLGLATLGAPGGAAGRASAYAMSAVGVVLLPTCAQVTYVELGGLGGPGLSGLWPAFVIAGVAGLVAAVLAGRLRDAAVPGLAAGGLVAVMAGLCAVRLFLPTPGGPILILPFVLLTVGAAVALTAALRLHGAVSALFALSLFFPAVLVGFLLGSGVQVPRLREATTPQALVDGFVDALHLWALIGGGLVLLVIVLGAVFARLLPGTSADTGTEGLPGTSDVPGTREATGAKDPVRGRDAAVPVVPGAAAEATPPGDGGDTRPRPVPDPAGEPAREPGPDQEKTAVPPVVVPPPTPSPEDDPANGSTLP